MNLRKMMRGILLPFAILLSFYATAQTRVITGRVTDPGGSGIPGVSVVVKGQSTGTTTGADGTYTIRVTEPGGTLLFSSIGYTTQEVPLSGKNVANAVLQSSSNNLNEVVVIGYGTRQKKDLTGSVSSVSAKDFQKGVIATPDQLIAGKIAGVSIVSNGGQPGSGSTIRIRGGSSLNASNDPLIVVDGVPLETSGIAGSPNPLSLINPNDIESMTVLKDASAAAIYGTRAANGVIIITTKKGSSGPFRVNFSTVNSVSAITKEVKVLNGEQVRSIVNQNGTAAQKSMVGNANTDWQSLIYQKAFASDNNISLTGGFKNLPYRISLGYLNQNGVLKTDNLQRNSASIALNPSLFDNHLKININLKGALEQARFANQGAIGTAVYFDPTQPEYSTSKRFNGLFEWLDANGKPNVLAAKNPVGMLNDDHNTSNVQRSIGNVQFDYKFHFLPDLHANLNLGYDVSKGTGKTFISDSSAIGYSNKGSNNHYEQKKQNTLLEFYLNYVKDIKSIGSRVDVMAGYSYNDFQTTNYNFPGYYANGTLVPGSTPLYPYDKPENSLVSYFGRANFTFHDRYLLTATIRDDGSSRFSSNNRWGIFPSGAFAWKIKDESFLKESNTVSDLKLRVGYGITGQQEGIADYGYMAAYNLSNNTARYQFGNTFYNMYRPYGYNPNLKWEQTATTNLGLDYGFLHNRITGTIDFYLKHTTNLLNSVPQPAGTNFSAYVLENVGSMDNKGVEFSINVEPIRNKVSTLDLSFNATYNKNTILNLTVVPNDPNYPGFPTTNISGVQGYAFINAVGTPKNTFYLYHQIYDKNGNPIEGLFEDVNRDGIINESDKYKGKSADPNLFFGFSANYSYKKWSAGFVMRANFNNYVYNNIYSNNGRLNQILGAVTTGNASVNYLETHFVGNTDQQLLSDYYLQNASFLRMDNLNVGYNFGRLGRNRFDLRASIIVQNVFVITKYTGLDPEISWGVDNNFYPRPRTYSLGLNLSL